MKIELVPRRFERVSRYRYGPREQHIEAIEERGFDNGTLLVNYLNLTLDEQNCIDSVWGYLPSHSVVNGFIDVPSHMVRADLRVDRAVGAGVSLRVNELDDSWPVVYDQRTGWLRVGDQASHYEIVEVRSALLIGLSARELACLWIKTELA